MPSVEMELIATDMAHTLLAQWVVPLLVLHLPRLSSPFVSLIVLVQVLSLA
jgi:hypothetical protein